MENKQYTQKSNTINPKYKIKDLCYEAIYGPASGGAKSTVAVDYKNFTLFLNNAYNIASRKEGVSAKYTKINKAHEYQLNSWVKVVSTQKIIQEKLVSDTVKIQNAREFGLEVCDLPLSLVEVNGKAIDFIRIDDKTILIEKIDGEFVFNQNSEVKPTFELISPNSIIYNGELIPVKDNRVVIEKYIDNEATHPEYPQIAFKLEKTNEKDQFNTVTIELEDDDSLDFSIYDVFFSEDVEGIYLSDNKKKEYKIASKQKEYGQLVIKVDQNDRIEDRGFVSIKNNTYQLKCQRNALNILVERPSIYHHPLLLLSDDKSKSYLSRFNNSTSLPIEYKVLTDSSKKGNSIQQQFVQKALQTPDFMILEGPPGSGKTTTILEFIYQALKYGKKVLLCASTHVAIDNVLEKILEHKQRDEFLRVINPLRVGDEDNVYVEEVKQYSQKRLNNNIPKLYKDIVLDSFNLVCGTTIGILQFPVFKELLGQDNNTQSIDPMFDYLIIDEASKTTFNEFLVPAVFAKKWVIVGDVKQLAPYVEKNDLVPTLINSAPLNNRDHREAIYFLKLIESGKKWVNKVFMMSSSSIKYIDGFLKNTNVIALTDTPLNNIQSISSLDIKQASSRLTMLSIPEMIIIGEDELVKNALPYLNNQYLVLSRHDNIGSYKPEIFKEFSILHHRNKELYSLLTKSSDEYGKKIEDEIIWRLIRMYELTNNRESNKTIGYDNYINSIKHYLSEEDSKKYDDIIATISEIALPSIITLIQNGLKKKSNNPKRTILNEGFSDEDRVNRFVSLEYQYRMHPEISELPRTYVYDNKALRDDVRSYPDFDYLNNNRRFEIRHITCDTVYKNHNENEVKAIMEELDKFIKFAANQNRNYDLAVLTFYNGQVFHLRKKLQKRFNSPNKFNFKEDNVRITLNNVDKFQGQEADIVYLSMVQNDRVGFLDSVNRMNVAITRAKDKVILFGNKEFFKNQTDSELLKQIYKHEFAPLKSANPWGW